VRLDFTIDKPGPKELNVLKVAGNEMVATRRLSSINILRLLKDRNGPDVDI